MTNYIPYRNSEIGENDDREKICRLGMSFDMMERRNGIIRKLTERDMCLYGKERVNPLIGKIPSRAEIDAELDELMMSM